MVVYYFKYPGTHDIGLSSTRVSARMKPLFSGAITPQSNRRHPWSLVLGYVRGIIVFCSCNVSICVWVSSVGNEPCLKLVAAMRPS